MFSFQAIVQAEFKECYNDILCGQIINIQFQQEIKHVLFAEAQIWRVPKNSILEYDQYQKKNTRKKKKKKKKKKKNTGVMAQIQYESALS